MRKVFVSKSSLAWGSLSPNQTFYREQWIKDSFMDKKEGQQYVAKLKEKGKLHTKVKETKNGYTFYYKK